MNGLVLRLRRSILPALALLLLLAAGCKELPVEMPKFNTPDFSLNCPGVTEHFANVDTFLVIGHRGAPTIEPENTIISYQRALDDGANALEIDLCMTEDGHVVLWHDWNPNDAIALTREQGGELGIKYRPRFPKVGSDMRKSIDELTLDEFRANYWYASKNILDKERVPVEIPTFAQFVEWAVNKPTLYYVMLDIKLPASKSYLGQTLIAKIDSTLKAHNPSFKSVYMTPQPAVWEIVANMIEGLGIAFDVDLGSGLIDEDVCNISSSSYAQRSGGGFATSMHPFVWTESPWTTLKKLLACDLQRRDAPRDSTQGPVVDKVIAATINDAEKMECLVDMGIDGLITNEPSLLRWIAMNKGKFVQ